MQSHHTRYLLHEQLQNILEILDRVLPTDDKEVQQIEKVETFSHTYHAVIEAEHAGMCRLPIDPKHWRFNGIIPSAHTTPSSKRWFIRRMTQHGSVWDDNIISTPNLTDLVPPSPPPGVRLWHENEQIRKTMMLTKYDLEELFKTVSQKEHACIPHTEDSHAYGGGITLLVTPRRVLGFRDGLRILRDSHTYVHKTCMEYAKMLCYLYNLSMEEFSTLTRMSITRRLGGTPITLQECGLGPYDSGPWGSAQIGVPHVSHDWSPSLMPQSHTDPHVAPEQTPVRMRIPEGTLMIVDSFARTCYCHGYTQEPRGDRKGSPYYYTLDFFMDSMRNSELTGYVPITGGMIMHTPVASKHAVERTPAARTTDASKASLISTHPLLELIRVIRARLQTEESRRIIHYVDAP